MLIDNEFFTLYLKDNQVLLSTKKTGFPLKSFDNITRELPRLKINSFPILRQALADINEDHVIGRWLPLIELSVFPNKMEAQLIVNVTVEELEMNVDSLLVESERILDEAGIIYGRSNLLVKDFIPRVPIVVAKGLDPEKGADAQITYIKMPKRKPVIREDGLADYYEMNFVFPIEEGEWVGEKMLPQEGIKGSDVYGNIINAARGKDDILLYDRKSVFEDNQDGKIVIRALHGGALEFKEGIVSIGKHLKIEGDVGPETGSITFDGAVTIFGTVLAGFSVTAKGDISVESNEGVSNAKIIQSSEGDIYIKGGIFGGGATIIEAQGNIYLKHANNCKLYGKEIHAGLYLFGSEIIADRVYVDKQRGKIIGGTVEALYSIETASVGNDHERMTILHAKGIDKEEAYKEVQMMASDLKERQKVIGKLEASLAKFEEMATDLSSKQPEVYEKMRSTIELNRVAITELDREIQSVLDKIKYAVPAQIEVTKEAFPGTVIRIGKKSSTLHDQTKGIFKIVDGVLNV